MPLSNGNNERMMIRMITVMSFSDGHNARSIATAAAVKKRSLARPPKNWNNFMKLIIYISALIVQMYSNFRIMGQHEMGQKR